MPIQHDEGSNQSLMIQHPPQPHRWHKRAKQCNILSFGLRYVCPSLFSFFQLTPFYIRFQLSPHNEGSSLRFRSLNATNPHTISSSSRTSQKLYQWSNVLSSWSRFPSSRLWNDWVSVFSFKYFSSFCYYFITMLYLSHC